MDARSERCPADHSRPRRRVAANASGRSRSPRIASRSRPVEGTGRIQLAHYRVDQLGRSARSAHFELRQLRLELAVDPELVVRLDRERFGRVIENLLDNATRYAPRGGRCVISARREGGTLEIAIGNNGPPVPLLDRDAIFGRYFQVERRRASARANRDLALYFCKLAVEAHGGTIRVEERGELGAVFVVTLPEPATAD